MSDTGKQLPIDNEAPSDKAGSDATADDPMLLLGERIDLLEQKIESGALAAEEEARSLLIKEIRQRITTRRVAVWVGLLVIVGMSAILWHGVHRYFLSVPVADWSILTIPQAVAITMFVAPVVSITTITVVLLVGAFRRFKDDDASSSNLMPVAQAGARVLSS